MKITNQNKETALNNLKCHDEIKLKDGSTLFVNENLENSVLCFDTDDWNDVADSTMYNMPIGLKTIDKDDIAEVIPFEFISK